MDDPHTKQPGGYPGGYPAQPGAGYPGGYPAQPGAAYPGGYPSQPGAAYAASPQTVIIQQTSQPRASMGGQIAFACVVVWCCNCLFGLIAFILAMVGSSEPDLEKAKQLGNASYGVSIAGLVTGLIVVEMVLGLYFT